MLNRTGVTPLVVTTLLLEKLFHFFGRKITTGPGFSKGQARSEPHSRKKELNTVEIGMGTPFESGVSNTVDAGKPISTDSFVHSYDISKRVEYTKPVRRGQPRRIDGASAL